ncbi:MAG: hypothetical protein AB7L65_06280 [Hyphomonadaceae bacterium]
MQPEPEQQTAAIAVPPEERLAYARDMLGELAAMARGLGFEALERALDLAEREAAWAVRRQAECNAAARR